MEKEIIIDGKNLVLGRTSSHIAKKLLNGEKVQIVNAEKMIITGDPTAIKAKYTSRRQRGSVVSGPFFPIRPDLIVRRTVRGMLPYKTNKGREAFKKLRVHVGNPKLEVNEESKLRPLSTRYMTVGKLSEALGWQKRTDARGVKAH